MWRPSKLIHYWELPEYWEGSWRPEETCCHSNSSERSSANTDVKNSQRVNNNNNNNIMAGEQQYKYQSESIKEAKEASNLLDITIQTDRKIKSNWPDIVAKE